MKNAKTIKSAMSVVAMLSAGPAIATPQVTVSCY